MKRRDFISSVAVAGLVPLLPASEEDAGPSCCPRGPRGEEGPVGLLDVLEERTPTWTVTYQDKDGQVTMIDKFYG
jgi:hypothetical protein